MMLIAWPVDADDLPAVNAPQPVASGQKSAAAIGDSVESNPAASNPTATNLVGIDAP